MIRGAEENRYKVFVDSFRCLIEYNYGEGELLDIVAPEGIPFVCGLNEQLELRRHGTRAQFKLQPGIVTWTSESIEFSGCVSSIHVQLFWV